MAAQAQTLSPRVAQMLSYLPPRSETLAVERGPIKIAQAKNKNSGRWRSPQAQTESESVLPANLQLSVVAPALAGRTLELSIEARSRFRPPKGFGLMPYDGCGILLLKPQPGQTRAALKARVWKGMKRITLAGQEVGVFEEKRELDLWRIYVCVPRPDMIVLATDRASMVTTLSRLQAPRLSDRAFPASWSGWKLVDTTAPFWAIRRLDLAESAGVLGPQDRDPKARAFVVYNRANSSSKAAPVWVMKYNGAPAFGRQLFDQIGREVKGTVTQPTGTGITQFTVSSPDFYFTFYALGLLGTGIYL